MRKWLPILVFCTTTALYLGGVALPYAAGESLSLNEALLPVLYAFSVVGFLIALRRPGNAVAWICMAIGAVWGLEAFLFGLVSYGVENPGTTPSPDLLAAFAAPLWIPGIFTIASFLLLLFPDGHLPSPRFRWVGWVMGVAIAGLYILSVLADPETFSYGRVARANPLADVLGPWLDRNEALSAALETTLVVAMFAGVAGSIVGLVMRFRRSRGVERQQLKWLATAGVIAVLLFVVAVFLVDYLGETIGLIAIFPLILIPVSIGVAVLRYRLYDIDRLVSRTVTYAVVVALLAGTFGLTALALGTLAGQNDPLAVAGATLTAAALFNPLRRRVQKWVDRRFNRNRYDAEQELDAFSRRLSAKFDVDSVTRDLMEVVTRTVTPSSATAWIRDDPDRTSSQVDSTDIDSI